ncbi:MAG TPA: hypothetical protein VEP67_12105 [Thiobacillaceae bacterium]|nr:hypothetical protein [Thiobacillaceae bacterium]
MRFGIIVRLMLLCWVASAAANGRLPPHQVSVGVAVPGVNIGINLPAYPELDVVPGYPVYYAPRVDANYFFYDGMYWVFQNDNWYASSWYNGPWELVNPWDVPAFVLRVPVRYYRRPPVYFRGWGYDAPPHWGDHWGRDWEQRRSGWDRWDRGAHPPPAPLPSYQRQYSGDRYPRQVEQQRELNRQNYRYQPNEPMARQPHQGQRGQSAPAPVQRGTQMAPQERNPSLQGPPRYNPPPSVQQSAPGISHPQAPQYSGGNMQRPAPTQTPPQQRAPTVQDQGRQPQGAVEYKQQTPGSRTREETQQGRDAKREPRDRTDQEQERGRR